MTKPLQYENIAIIALDYSFLYYPYYMYCIYMRYENVLFNQQQQ